jgi:DNA-binding CsgD family transcriptional regulator/tetratricopeptide (TPR) repeat protein
VPSSPAPERVRLIERDRELALLGDLDDRAVAGHSGFVRVLGEAGAGKSALVHAAMGMAEERGLRVAFTSPGQLDSRSPYGAVRRHLHQPVAALSPDEHTRMLSGPARLAVRYLTEPDAVAMSQADLLHSLSWLVEELAGLHPLLLVVDDAQWADEESLLFLGSVHETVHELPVLVLLAMREVGADERGAALASLVAQQTATEVRVAHLSLDGISTLLASLWGDPSEGVDAAVLELTGGNPFLVLALARLLESASPRSVELVRGSVPTSVVDAAVARLAALGASERALATAVAVLEAGSLATTSELAGLDIDEASDAADRLRGAALFADTPTLRFRHALLRSAVYAATGVSRRDRLHRSAARLLAQDFDAASAHALAASGTGDPWVVELLRRTAARALTTGAPQTAVALLRRAEAEPPDDRTLPSLLLELGLAEMRTTDPSCVTTLQRASELLTDPADLTRCVVALAEAFNYAGLHEEAAVVLEKALGRLVDADLAGADRDLLLVVEAALVAAGLLIPARVGEARLRLAERTDLAGATDGERQLLLQQLASAAATNRPADEIRRLAARAMSDADRPEVTDWVWARLVLAAVGDLDDVRRLTDEGFAQAASSGSVIGFVTATFVRGVAEYWGGDLTLAETHFRALLEQGAALDAGPLVPLLGRGNLAQTLAWQGHLDEAVELIAPFPEKLPATYPVNGVVTLDFARADVRSMTGDHEGALRAAEHAGRLQQELDVDSPTWASWRPFAITPLRHLGRLDDARRMAAEQLVLCERSGVEHLVGEALRLVAEVADPCEGLPYFERSVSVLDRTGSRLQLARSRLAFGAALRRAGQRSHAQQHLELGRALAQACGARGLVDLAESELRACGARPRRLSRSGAEALTPSERRVAELAAAGLSNGDIARQLFVSLKTVETHLSRVYRKLSISGRAGLHGALRDHG